MFRFGFSLNFLNSKFMKLIISISNKFCFKLFNIINNINSFQDHFKICFFSELY